MAYGDAILTWPPITKEDVTGEPIDCLENAKVKYNSFMIDNNGTYYLDLSNTSITNVPCLADILLPSLHRYSLHRCLQQLESKGIFIPHDGNVSEYDIQQMLQVWSPVLISLNLSDTAVVDLAPLKEIPLKRLVIASTPIADLSQLKGMYIQELDFDWNITSGMDDVRHLCSLQKINGIPTNSYWSSYEKNLPNIRAYQELRSNKWLYYSYEVMLDVRYVIGYVKHTMMLYDMLIIRVFSFILLSFAISYVSIKLIRKRSRGT